jgi:hypothetical protein
MRSSQSRIASMAGMLKQAIGKQADPRRREILTRFSENIEADIEDMKVLSDPSAVTQEQLDEVTSKITERMNKLTESLRPPEE